MLIKEASKDQSLRSIGLDEKTEKCGKFFLT